jgi:hypothetical protein
MLLGTDFPYLSLSGKIFFPQISLEPPGQLVGQNDIRRDHNKRLMLGSRNDRLFPRSVVKSSPGGESKKIGRREVASY